ncbi:MAG: hypothetical protein ACLQBJ_08125 [Bryobacteraceae bacterium]
MAQASAIRVIEQARDRLVIYQPPYWPFAIGFLIAAVVIAVFVFGFLTLLSVRLPLRFAGLILALPFLFFSAKAALQQMFVQVSVPDRTLTIRHVGMFGTDARVLPLDEVDGVVQLRARRSTAVGLRLRSGETINLTGFTDQAGKDGMLLSLQLFLAGAKSGY